MNKMDKVSQIIRKAIVNWNEMDIDISISDYISTYLLKSGMEFVVHCEDCVYYKKGYESYCDFPEDGLVYVRDNFFCYYGDKKKNEQKYG